MNPKVVMISDFNERAWAIEDYLKQFTDCEIVWMSAPRLKDQAFALEHADVVIIDADKFDLAQVMTLKPSSRIILLVESENDPIAQYPFPENVSTLLKTSSAVELMRVFQPLRPLKFDPLSLRL
ncbi:MAG TPA: hypothetical protein VFV50_16550 [Bdellovibrionales bacterium]|nr:hypothetical protein [Bdellovibrionales bacterium]